MTVWLAALPAALADGSEQAHGGAETTDDDAAEDDGANDTETDADAPEDGSEDDDAKDAEEEEGDDDDASEDEASDDADDADEAASDDGQEDGDDADGDDEEDEEAIVVVAPTRHLHVEARSLRLTESGAAKLLSIAERFHAATGRKIVVTGGDRGAEKQAELMYKKLENGEDLLKLYARDDLVRPIIASYKRVRGDGGSKQRTINAMRETIAAQMENKQYVSRHLNFTAADIRSRDMDDDQVTSFRNAVKAEGGVTLIDERKSAAPCFHLSF